MSQMYAFKINIKYSMYFIHIFFFFNFMKIIKSSKNYEYDINCQKQTKHLPILRMTALGFWGRPEVSGTAA